MSVGKMVRAAVIALAAVAALATAACGSDGPTGPTPPPPIVQPPANNQPVIESITLRNTRARAPENFADVSDTIEVSAQVRDDETPVSQLQFQWNGSNGTFTGTGTTVTWNPDPGAMTPVEATVTLQVIERYGHPGGALNWEHRVSRTSSVRLHHSTREVGDMSQRFLTEFSKPQTNKDWQDVMKDFKAAACPDPREFDAEREDVIRHYTFFTMHDFRIDPPVVSVNFGGTCSYLAKRGDACASVPVFWDSTDNRAGIRGRTTGIGHLTAAYSAADSRWWLCSSYFQPTTTFGHSFYSAR